MHIPINTKFDIKDSPIPDKLLDVYFLLSHWLNIRSIMPLPSTFSLFGLLMILMSAPDKGYSKCGERVVTRNGTSNRIVLLFPLTISKENQSYNMPMILKDIAYTQKYLGTGIYDGIVTYDFCNDLSVLIEILFKLCLDAKVTFWDLHVTIHGSMEQIAITDLILAYFDILSDLFINDYKRGDSYNGYAYYEIDSGFINAQLLEYVDGFLDIPGIYRISINLCYFKNHHCLCLPFRYEESSSKVLGNYYLSEYSDIHRILNLVLLQVADNKKSILRVSLTTMTQADIKHISSIIKKEYSPFFQQIDFIFYKGGTGQYFTHNINCSTSPFIKALEKEKLCQHTFKVKTIKKYGDPDDSYSPIGSLNDYKCKPRCPAGKSILFNEKKYIWQCQHCSNNSVKLNIGNGICNPCSPGWLANINKTQCYDTYKNLALLFTDDSATLILSLSAILVVSISFTFFLYLKYRSTPVVKSSNLLLSVVQLVSQFVLAVIMPFIFIGTPNVSSCTLRPLLVGLLLTISASVTNSKTRTLLRIFDSDIKLTKREMKKTRATEIFVLVVFLLIDSAILFISFKFKAPKELLFASETEKYREKHCNTDDHLIFQLVWIFVMLFTNSVMAFRARHLPESFKETRIIILSSILSCVIVGNVTWLSFLQEKYYWKTIFIFYSIYILNATNFLILYGYKVYILLFVPRKNTSTYFNLRIRQKIMG